MPRSKAFQFALSASLLTFVAAMAIAQEVSVESLIKALGSNQVATQVAAAADLAELGDEAAPAVGALTQSLSSPDAKVRSASAIALAAIGPKAKAATSALVQALSDDDPAVRARAAYALGTIGDASDATLKAMIAAALDTDVTVRRQVRDALRAIKPPREKTLPMWVQTLRDADPDVVMPALMTLAEEGAMAVPVLRDALKDEDACYWATLVAAEIGPDAKDLTPDLVSVLKHADPECRMNALVALGEIGPGAKNASGDIIALLETEGFGSVQYAAAYALSEIDNSDATRKTLAKLLDSKDLGLRSIAARGLLIMDPDGPQEEKANKIAIEALGSDDPDIRHLAVRTLAEVAPREKSPSPEIIDAFVKVLDDSSPHVVGEVIGALASQGKSAAPRVVRGLANEKLRPYAIQVAILLGPDAEIAVPALIKTLDETANDPQLKREVQFALGAIGKASAPAVPKLMESLKSTSPEVCYSACYALGKIGPPAKAAIPELMQQLKSDDDFQRLASIWALIRIEPHNSRVEQIAIPLLTKSLSDPREHIRIKAANGLGLIGSAAKSALPALRQASQDASPNVAAAAKEAMEEIQGQ